MIAGLGNPGPEYAENRHNVGFQILDQLAKKYRLSFRAMKFQGLFASGSIAAQRVVLVKPLAYMNRSGQVLAPALKAYGLPPDRLLVVYDDLDLPLGQIRLRPKGSSGGHKGMASIVQSLKSEEFPRLRVGIGRPTPGEDAEAYVLSDFSPQEDRAGAYERAIDAIEVLLTEGLVVAMNRFN
ncbi:MAG: aminoacyl-tRNA hydrolase [Chloroflexi bacterium]|nr:aminoacyl-tRNA hydrolase [Chloroflexota bacterium]